MFHFSLTRVLGFGLNCAPNSNRFRFVMTLFLCQRRKKRKKKNKQKLACTLSSIGKPTKIIIESHFKFTYTSFCGWTKSYKRHLKNVSTLPIADYDPHLAFSVYVSRFASKSKTRKINQNDLCIHNGHSRVHLGTLIAHSERTAYTARWKDIAN